jgi:CheY-like chemotaxis protein
MAKILLIEDDPLIFRLYQRLFSLEGFQIEIAENGQAGLDKLNSFTPDIILLDIMMPTMNGIEMMSRLKDDEITKNIPVVVLTNLSDMRVTNMALAKGAVLYIIKSQTEPADVIATVKSVLEKQNNQQPDSSPPESV